VSVGPDQHGRSLVASPHPPGTSWMAVVIGVAFLDRKRSQCVGRRVVRGDEG
jgi:hypothetical protein